eukprot:8335760-Pyramimonas_sp.AAC.1
MRSPARSAAAERPHAAAPARPSQGVRTAPAAAPSLPPGGFTIISDCESGESGVHSLGVGFRVNFNFSCG